MSASKTEPQPFTAYQIFLVAILALLQFSVVLDFMIISPIGDYLIKALDMTPARFGTVVSAYAFSAGAAGILAAGYADRFDRKKLLLFFYAGFILGTLFCALAVDFWTLLAARIVTGLFGGVISSVSLAIVGDLFSLEQRGRVMGFVQMSFSASQILGIPAGLYLAHSWGWEFYFFHDCGRIAVRFCRYCASDATHHAAFRLANGRQCVCAPLAHRLQCRPLGGFCRHHLHCRWRVHDYAV